ncbi:MAG: phosphate ABC transporter substrate-binding protein [Gammaproteobacteria bacterium]|nr:phosphate ABC transporter substrate-binding protein [Gammaproteobacteria bacterium]
MPGIRVSKAGCVSGTLLSFVLLSAMADAGVVVIGSPGLDVSTLSEKTVRNLYLGKTVQLDNGIRVEVIDLPSGNSVRDEFYEKVIGKDTTQVKAYWAKRIFTGKGSPPDTKLDERSVVKWVNEAPGRIGYVSPDAATDSARVLLRAD